jgi:hypothetical protein
MNRKCYIAGKVTGLPYDDVFDKFQSAAFGLKLADYDVVNPMEIVPKRASWDKAMDICIEALLTCDCIYMLPDWKDSKGARLEFETAMNFKLTIVSRLTIYEHEKLYFDMTKDDKNDFLARGGILLRPAEDKDGSPIIKQRTREKDWHTRLTFNRTARRDEVLARLAQDELLFKID